MRQSSFQRIDIPLSRDIESKYDDIKAIVNIVIPNMAKILQVAEILQANATGCTTTNSDFTNIPSVETLPSTAQEGQLIKFDSGLYIWDGTQWVLVEEDFAGDSIPNADTYPENPAFGQTVLIDGTLYKWDGSQWIVMTENVIEDTAVNITVPSVDTLPETGTIGELVYFEGSLYIYTEAGWEMVTSSGGDSFFVDSYPESPVDGDVVIDLTGGLVATWDGSQWVEEEYTPEASAVTKIGFSDALPATAEEGDITFNSSDGQLYFYNNGAWQNMGEALTPTASSLSDITIVSELPLEVTEGAVLYNSSDKKLYEGVNGLWTQVVEPTTAATEVADASITVAKFAAGIRPVEIVTSLPSENNTIGRLVYLTTDGKLYRYTASGWSSAVQAVDLTGQIGSTQIADNAISTQHISANSITGDMIQANTITVEMLTADALAIGTISAGAISATELASGAVTTDKLYAGAVTATKIATNSIDATKIVAGTISGDKISANAITAGHIQTGAVTASEIAASAITADKIASNAITAAKISAGAIGATQISANAITSDKIATGAVTASEISAGAITADKLDVDALIGKRVQMDSTQAYSTQYFTDSYFGTNSSAFSFKNTNRTYGIACEKTNSGNGNAVYGLCSNAYQTGSAVVGVQESSLSNSWGGWFYHKNWTAIACSTGKSDGQWGAWTADKMYAGGGFSPFTGSHIVYSKDILKQGELVYSDDAWAVNVDNALIHVSKTKTAKERKVIGIVSYAKDTLLENIQNNPMVAEVNFDAGTSKIKPEFQEYVDYLVDNDFKEVEINSVGEGGILVCSENGNIDNGDYLASANLAGYAMKQDDDLLHNYTVAKALESVDWSKESSTTKMIACTYHCG